MEFLAILVHHTSEFGLLEEGLDLGRALAAARAVFGSRFNPLLSLKALSYFADGDLVSLPPAVQSLLLAAVQAADLSRVPEIDPLPGGLLP